MEAVKAEDPEKDQVVDTGSQVESHGLRRPTNSTKGALKATGVAIRDQGSALEETKLVPLAYGSPSDGAQRKAIQTERISKLYKPEELG